MRSRALVAILAAVALGAGFPAATLAPAPPSLTTGPAPPSELGHMHALVDAVRAGEPGGTPPSAAGGGHPPQRPAGIFSSLGWNGLDSGQGCGSACLTPNPSIAAGSGYVIEVTDQVYRVWSTNGTYVANGSLDTLLGTATDTLTGAEMRYDATYLRWVVVAVDATRDQVVFAGSLTSDPTSSWTAHRFPPLPGGDSLAQPEVGFTQGALVVTANVERGGSLYGSQILAANKTELFGGHAVTMWTGPVNTSLVSLVPAQSVGSSATLYLVTDNSGGGPLQLLSLTGGPPSRPTVSWVASYVANVSAPPPAPQNGSPDRIASGDGRVQSAGWNGSVLWAVADSSCVPSGDTASRACLQFWEISPSTSTPLQEFNWSSGPGMYDLYPALAVDGRGNVGVTFEETSNTTDPRVMATVRTGDAPADTLAPIHALHPSYGPASARTCSGGRCAFGNYSGVASGPYGNGTFWTVGEYTGTNATASAWRTWVNQVVVIRGYPVVFRESGLPGGLNWSVTVNGITVASNGTNATIYETSGHYTYAIDNPVTVHPGAQFVGDPTTGSFQVNGSAVALNLTFSEQFRVNLSAAPAGAGVVSPASGWYSAGAPLVVSAVAATGYLFEGWTGDGAGAYSGRNDPTSVSPSGPINETATFYRIGEYGASFTESGLPPGMGWSVEVNGATTQGTVSTLVFEEPNGSYSFVVSSPIGAGPGTRYAAAVSSGSFRIAGASASVAVEFVTQYQLNVTAAVPGTGAVNPPSGWYDEGRSLDLTALDGPGHVFSGWQGTGAGAYSGPADPLDYTVSGPASEVAEFVAAQVYPVVFAATGLAAGSVWTVSIDGLGQNSSDGTLTFYEPNGTYSFATGLLATQGSLAAYSASPATGRFSVQGGEFHQTIAFSLSGESALNSPRALFASTVLLAGLLAAALAVGVLALVRLQRRPPRALPVIITVPARLPDPWDESPPAPVPARAPDPPTTP